MSSYTVEEILGTVFDAGKKERKKADWTNIQLRISTDLIEKIGSILKERKGLSRNAWILEAIQEKIKRDSHE